MAMDDRKRRVLQAVVTLYGIDGEPVGSGLLCRYFDSAVSSATLRNEMAALTKLGLLEQPHTSAGRVPSAKGYRYYLDHMDAPAALPAAEKRKIDRLFAGMDYEPDKLTQSAAKALSDWAGFTVVATTPAAPDLVFECGAALTPLPAENKNHPLGFGFGALLGMGGFTYYVAGDTDVLADVACDVLFMPCDGQYNMLHFMDQVPAQLAAMDHKPGVVVPYHYAGYMEGSDENGPRLAEKLKELGYNVRLLCRP